MGSNPRGSVGRGLISGLLLVGLMLWTIAREGDRLPEAPEVFAAGSAGADLGELGVGSRRRPTGGAPGTTRRLPRASAGR